jgi:hypothetical protein
VFESGVASAFGCAFQKRVSFEKTSNLCFLVLFDGFDALISKMKKKSEKNHFNAFSSKMHF